MREESFLLPRKSSSRPVVLPPPSTPPEHTRRQKTRKGISGWQREYGSNQLARQTLDGVKMDYAR